MNFRFWKPKINAKGHGEMETTQIITETDEVTDTVVELQKLAALTKELKENAQSLRAESETWLRENGHG